MPSGLRSSPASSPRRLATGWSTASARRLVPTGAFPALRRLDQLPSDFVLRGLKLGASATAMRYLAKRRGVAHLSLRHIPFRALDRFDFTLHEPMTAPNALGYPSIFDACTAAGRPWAYLDASRVRQGE